MPAVRLAAPGWIVAAAVEAVQGSNFIVRDRGRRSSVRRRSEAGSGGQRRSDSLVVIKDPVSLPGAVVNLSLESCIASCRPGDFLMFSSREAFENDFCPVRDELLGEMYRANENGLPQLVESVSSDVRAMLALFCYRRSHLHSLALAIAASCSERELIELGGRAGSILYALSREPAARSVPSSSSRKPITLSTKPLSTFAAADDDLDEDLAKSVRA